MGTIDKANNKVEQLGGEVKEKVSDVTRDNDLKALAKGQGQGQPRCCALSRSGAA
jgi:uncharacterized protein YjbJ (UPF0337 family)